MNSNKVLAINTKIDCLQQKVYTTYNAAFNFGQT